MACPARVCRAGVSTPSTSRSVGRRRIGEDVGGVGVERGGQGDRREAGAGERHDLLDVGGGTGGDRPGSPVRCRGERGRVTCPGQGGAGTWDWPTIAPCGPAVDPAAGPPSPSRRWIAPRWVR